MRADAPTLRVPYVFHSGKCGDVRGVVLQVEQSALIFLECPKVFARMDFHIVRGLCVRLPWYSRGKSASHAENVRGSARSLRCVLDTFTIVCVRPRLFLVYSTYVKLMYHVLQRKGGAFTCIVRWDTWTVRDLSAIYQWNVRFCSGIYAPVFYVWIAVSSA